MVLMYSIKVMPHWTVKKIHLTVHILMFAAKLIPLLLPRGWTDTVWMNHTLCLASRSWATSSWSCYPLSQTPCLWTDALSVLHKLTRFRGSSLQTLLLLCHLPPTYIPPWIPQDVVGKLRRQEDAVFPEDGRAVLIKSCHSQNQIHCHTTCIFKTIWTVKWLNMGMLFTTGRFLMVRKGGVGPIIALAKEKFGVLQRKMASELLQSSPCCTCFRSHQWQSPRGGKDVGKCVCNENTF